MGRLRRSFHFPGGATGTIKCDHVAFTLSFNGSLDFHSTPIREKMHYMNEFRNSDTSYLTIETLKNYVQL